MKDKHNSVMKKSVTQTNMFRGDDTTLNITVLPPLAKDNKPQGSTIRPISIAKYRQSEN